MNQRKLLIVTIILMGALLAIWPTQAQNSIRLSMAVPQNMLDIAQEVAQDFEAQYPNIAVYIVPDTAQWRYQYDTEAYLNTGLDFVQQADVVFVTDTQLAPEATRAGYFLDLAPLTRTDPFLNETDFYPSMWQSFQWDGGMWALPVAGDVIGMVYDRAAFDEAGLPYPSAFWTMADFEFALRQLATYNSDGTVNEAAFTNLGDAPQYLMFSLMGQTVYDASFDLAPNFDDPQLQTYMEQLITLYQEGLIGTQGGRLSLDQTMLIGRTLYATLGRLRESDTMDFALLPGGAAGVTVTGVAVSGGTAYPEEAYTLARFITESVDVTSALNNPVPARRDLLDAQANTTQDRPGGGGFRFAGTLPDDLRPIVEQALEVAIPAGHMQYSQYLNRALNAMLSDGVDATTALNDIETQILDSLAIADSRAGTIAITIATPPAAIALAPGQVEITFGVQSLINPLPNQNQWDDLIAQFIANDPEVARVNLEVLSARGRQLSLEEIAQSTDCFYQTSNIVPEADLEWLLSIDPLLFSDPTFDQFDMVGNVLLQMQRNMQTWGMPLHIQPQAMWYSADIFNQSGAFLPYAGWTVGDFELALRTIKFSPDDPAPFTAQDNAGTALLTLIASYGGLPVDYRTTPPTLDFNSPQNVEAIRQVLDLAKNGYLDYTALAGFGNFLLGQDEEAAVALYSQLVSALDLRNARFRPRQQQTPVDYDMTLFPDGTDYTGLAYDVGAAYISSQTEHAEGCYRFISMLAQTPSLFTGMPARRSQINSDVVLSTQGNTAVDFYTALDSEMQQPDAVLFPIGFSGGRVNASEQLVTYWLYRAFDRYVLEDADLQLELDEAQVFATAFQGCTANIPPYDPALQTQFDYLSQYINCAIEVDPSTESLFPNVG